MYIYFLRNKDEAFEVFEKYKAWSIDRWVIKCNMDRGGEYFGKASWNHSEGQRTRHK